MKLLTFCLLAGVFPGWSETRGATFAPITLYVQFQQPPSEGVILAIQDELEEIMDHIGLHFEWRDLAKAGHEVSAELAVVSFKGRCDLAGIGGRSKFEGALGWTHISDGQILPFTDISCDRVREFAQSGLVAINAGEREEKYGRALARVLAHELYHIFANTMHHARIEQDALGCGRFTSIDMCDDADIAYLIEIELSFCLFRHTSLRLGRTFAARPERFNGNEQRRGWPLPYGVCRLSS